MLTKLVPADYGALGVCASGLPEDYRWTVVEVPPAFFAAYPEMAPHDFVRKSVAAQPNVVLRDEDMVSRAELESNIMYHRAREVGVPIEQVMAVMLHVDDRWQSGLSLYRERRRPFTERERELLQYLTPAIVNAVRSCELFGAARDASSALDRLLAQERASILIVTSRGVELSRTVGAAHLIEKWFAPHERRGLRLPEPLGRFLEELVRTRPPESLERRWTSRRAAATLVVDFLSLGTICEERRWILRFREELHDPPVPSAWRARLTKRQREVAAGVLRGWDNQLIATELGCAEATVKKHLQSVFQKLGVENRTALVVRAAMRNQD
jgi:DNA-binding CsgD family transcriptional regulator